MDQVRGEKREICSAYFGFVWGEMELEAMAARSVWPICHSHDLGSPSVVVGPSPLCSPPLPTRPPPRAWPHPQRRFNTKTSYTQVKYNLIREDSEGYAKLVACLNHSGEGALTEETVPLMFREIQVWEGGVERGAGGRRSGVGDDGGRVECNALLGGA